MATLLSEFKVLKQQYVDFEEFKDLTIENIENSLKLAERIKEYIRREGLFSNNELIEDLPTESIPLLLVPFYQASIILKITDLERRKTNLEFAESYIDEFLTHLDNYRLTPEQFIEKRKSTTAPTREEKISAYKAKKELESTIKALEGQNLDDCRDLYAKELELAAIQSLDHLDFIRLELQMLSMRDLPKSEPAPYKPPTIVKIDESNLHMMPHLISGAQDLVNIKENLKAAVFTQRNAPSMTIEEYGEWAYEEMKQREKITKESKDAQVEYDSDEEGQREEKRVKDSSWDNWKDDHEKGAGNRNGR